MNQNVKEAFKIDETELWAVVNGLEWAWEKKVKKLEIQTDSKTVYDWLHDKCELRGPSLRLVEKYRNWERIDWVVMAKIIYREQNNAANQLAKMATMQSEVWRELRCVPECIAHVLNDDSCGSLRLVVLKRGAYKKHLGPPSSFTKKKKKRGFQNIMNCAILLICF